MPAVQTQVPPILKQYMTAFGPGDLLIYNDIALQIMQARLVNRQAIYNGPDYLYTRHTMQFAAVYNPAVMSYGLAQGGTLMGNQPPDPQRFLGLSPAQTDAALRSHLLMPRRQLWWIMGPTGYTTSNQPTLLLQSPNLVDDSGIYAPTDANNGPTPLYCSVTHRVGVKTFFVDFLIQTDINEINVYNSNLPPAILSNRWSMTQSMDDQFFCTRVIDGAATFRTDVLYMLSLNPDDFREWFFFPVPAGFKRTQTSVQQNPEGTVISYRIVDVEQQISVMKSMQDLYGVAKIEGTHLVEEYQEGWEAVSMKRPELGIAKFIYEGGTGAVKTAQDNAMKAFMRNGQPPAQKAP